MKRRELLAKMAMLPLGIIAGTSSATGAILCGAMSQSEKAALRKEFLATYSGPHYGASQIEMLHKSLGSQWIKIDFGNQAAKVQIYDEADFSTVTL